MRKEVHTKDLTNQRFGRLTVIKKIENKRNGSDRSALWLCKCACGNETTVRGSSLRNGDTKSCGCLRKEILNNSIKLYTPRKVEIKYNHYDLTGKYGIGYTHKGEEFYFDLEDYEKIKDYCWCLADKKKYVSNSRYGIRMHRLIMNCKK